MGLPNENRQCCLCDQMVPSHVNGIELVFLGKKRVLHEGCAKLISETYMDYVTEYKKSLISSSSA